jgi:SAM-dependent methyltransferase
MSMKHSTLATTNTSSTYDPTMFATLASAEDNHFWFRSRNHIIGSLVKDIVADLPPDYRLLEIGCGTGNVLRVLESVCVDGTVVGMDLFLEGLVHARTRTHCGLVQGDVHSPPFRTRFHLIGLFDVIEHLANDIEILSATNRLLVEDGILIVTVPAHPELWSYFDELHHYRRYGADELHEKLISAGYEVLFLSQYMMSIYPLVWIGRRLADRMDKRPKSDAKRTQDLTKQELRSIPLVNNLLTWTLSQELHWLRHKRALPLGTSLVAIARRRKS